MGRWAGDVAEWEALVVRDLGGGVTVVSLREFLRELGVPGFRAGRLGSRYSFGPEWWEVFRGVAARWWDGGQGVDPRTGGVFTREALAGLLA